MSHNLWYNYRGQVTPVEIHGGPEGGKEMIGVQGHRWFGEPWRFLSSVFTINFKRVELRKNLLTL